MSHLEIIRPARTTRWHKLATAVRSMRLGPWSSKDPELAKYFGGSAAAAGVPVNEETALNYAAVWNAVNLISSDIAKLPLPLYKVVGDGKEKFKTHPLYRLLHDEPNSEMHALSFRRLLQANVLVWGNGYAEIERDRADRPVALWPLLPQGVQAYRETPNGPLRYRVWNPSGTPIEFEARDILHLSGLGADGITGYTLVGKARESLGLGIATERFGATFFGNGATFGGVIKYPAGAATNPQAREDFRKMIEKRHQGVDRAHRFLAIYDGGEYQQLGVPPESAQFLETRKFQITEVARWFNLPVHKLKDLERSTNSNIEHQALEYVTDTLTPWLKCWEQELNRKLISRLERNQQVFEHITEGLLRGDAAGRGEFYGKLFNIGAITPNEIRARENLNPIAGGDTVFVPVNTLPLDRLNEWIDKTLEAKKAPETQPQNEDDKDDADSDPTIEELKAVIAAMERRLTEDTGLAAGKAHAETLADTLGRENEGLRAELELSRQAESARTTERDTARQELADATGRLTGEQTAHAETVGELSAAKVQVDTLGCELKGIRAELQESRERETALTAECQTVKDHLFAREAQLANEQQRATTAEQALNLAIEKETEAGLALTREVDARSTSEAQLRAECDAAQQQCADAERFGNEQEQRAIAAEAAVTAERERGAQTVSELVEHEVGVLAQRDEALHRVQVLAAECETAAAARLEAERQLTVEREQRVALEAQLRSVEGDRDTARQAAAAAESAHADIRTEHELLEQQYRSTAETLQHVQVEARTRRAVLITAMRGLFVDTLERLLQREIDRARKNQQTPQKLRTWADHFYPLHAEACRAALRPVVQAWATLVESDAEALLERMVSSHVDASTLALRQLAELHDADELAAQLERTLRRWETERPGAIADALVKEGMTHG